MKTIMATILILNINCVINSDYEIDHNQYNTYDIDPFWDDTRPINTAAPEENIAYNASGVKFNWARDNISYFTVLISRVPLTSNGDVVENITAIVASTDSTYTESDGNSMGYLGADAFFSHSKGEKTNEVYSFSAGTYYWLVLGFSEAGELTHSSKQTRFYIY